MRVPRKGRIFVFFFQAEDGIRDYKVTGVQTCALPISFAPRSAAAELACAHATRVCGLVRRARSTRSERIQCPAVSRRSGGIEGALPAPSLASEVRGGSRSAGGVHGAAGEEEVPGAVRTFDISCAHERAATAPQTTRRIRAARGLDGLDRSPRPSRLNRPKPFLPPPPHVPPE